MQTLNFYIKTKAFLILSSCNFISRFNIISSLEHSTIQLPFSNLFFFKSFLLRLLLSTFCHWNGLSLLFLVANCLSHNPRASIYTLCTVHCKCKSWKYLLSSNHFVMFKVKLVSFSIHFVFRRNVLDLLDTIRIHARILWDEQWAIIKVGPANFILNIEKIE